MCNAPVLMDGKIKLSYCKQSLLKVEFGTMQFVLDLPMFEIDGIERSNFEFECAELIGESTGGDSEYVLKFACDAYAQGMLIVRLKVYPSCNAVRFRYELKEFSSARLTKRLGVDNLVYTGLDYAGCSITEVQFSQFEPLMHTFCPQWNCILSEDALHQRELIGPILLLTQAENCLLISYEHGAQAPDSFIYYELCGGKLRMRARKGNYYAGQSLDAGYITPWMLVIGSTHGSSGALLNMRELMLNHIALNHASRKPYIFYNTWNRQERDRNWHKRPYLYSMNERGITEEIEVAHRMGIEVFVIDAGWFKKTGDWLVNREFFPNGLDGIAALLKRYDMKLGLWFNPTVAAQSSKICLEHPEYRMTRNGAVPVPFEVWETEASYSMCLCSEYADYFISTMIRLHQQYGVSYFKWDAISQYGCDSPDHAHGNTANSPQERADCYAFQMGMQMSRIVETVSAACPDVIVDFDITEGGRYVGLGFLASGKYFLINNGAYARDLDLPEQYALYHEAEPVHMDGYTNLYFQPGPARNTLCRHGLQYDVFCPSILFLTHVLPDGSRLDMDNAFATLVLGGNGIWGYLAELTEAQIEYWRVGLARYKRVREAVTSASPITVGFPGSSPEIHEKLTNDGQGIISIFTRQPGTFSHITRRLNAPGHIDGADTIEYLSDGCVKVTVNLERNAARVITFE